MMLLNGTVFATDPLNDERSVEVQLKLFVLTMASILSNNPSGAFGLFREKSAS